jgi:hypothetical protein
MSTSRTQFEQAADESRPSFVREVLFMLSNNKKWWLLPILFVFAAVGALLLLAGTGAAPFIYTLF